MLGKENIQRVLADREFAIATLSRFFHQQAIPFYVRIKEGAWFTLNGKKWRKANTLFSSLKVREKIKFPIAVWLYGQKVYLAGSRSERGELMIVATTQAPQTAIAIRQASAQPAATEQLYAI